MKKLVYDLIESHNNMDEGILISMELDEYVEKLFRNANIITYTSQGILQGFIAFYANRQEGEAFLSMLLVDKKCHGQKIGSLLLKSSIGDLIDKEFNSYNLEVLKSNTKAISFYKKFGFRVTMERGEFLHMNLNLMES